MNYERPRMVAFFLLIATLASVASGADSAAERRMTAERFRDYIRLLNEENPRHADYYTPQVTRREAMLELDREQRRDQIVVLTPEEIYIDDQNDTLAAIMTLRQVARHDGVKLGSRTEAAHRGDALVSHTVMFYGLVKGRISSVRAARSEGKLEHVDLATAAAEAPKPSDLLLPMPATVNQPRMSREKFADYAMLFTRFDPRFVEYYVPDVLFATLPAKQPLHGRQAILDLYIPIRRYLDEHVSPGTVVVDSSQNTMIAEIHNRMTATRGDVPLPSRTLKQGDVRDGWGVIRYGLRDGRISAIHGIDRNETFEAAAPR
jgi:hypothetical protein